MFYFKSVYVYIYLVDGATYFVVRSFFSFLSNSFGSMLLCVALCTKEKTVYRLCYLSANCTFSGITHISDFHVMQTSPCNEYPLTPHCYIVKLGFTGVYIFFLFLL